MSEGLNSDFYMASAKETHAVNRRPQCTADPVSLQRLNIVVPISKDDQNGQMFIDPFQTGS